MFYPDKKYEFIHEKLLKLLFKRRSFATLLNNQTDQHLLEQIIWFYICSTKSKYISSQISIRWIDQFSIRENLLTPRYSSEYCSKGVILYENRKVFNYHGLIKNLQKELIEYFISKDDFFICVQNSSKQFNLNKAIYALRLVDEELCAKHYDFYRYATVFLITSLICCTYISTSCIILSSFFSITHNILKILLINKGINYSTTPSYNTPISFFPIYTILIPLYLEPDRLEFLVNVISQLQYPKNRLDVKLVLEEDDYLTQKALSFVELPDYFQIIKVPFSQPRTKPKALNYALQYASGDYVTIFDAEDHPEQNQLLKSLQTFNTIGEKYVCLQAKLNYYNRDENILTKMQSLEYTIWFEYLLQGLCAMNHFIPLGGTSCHFRMAEIRKLGCWDPFNVTEDMDLGIRIYSKGYRTYMLDSTTLEEAIITLFAWLKQRARWIKGYIQSYIVFCNNKRKFKLKFQQRIVIDIFVGFCVMNFLIPIHFMFMPLMDHWFVNTALYLNIILSASYLTCSATTALLTQRSSVIKLNRFDILTVIAFIFYFILHTIAAYIALFELITAPFKWNKTRHGVSKVL